MSGKLLKILSIAFVFYAVLCMLHWPIGFTYFTLLSNIFAAAVCALQLIRGRGSFHVLKFTSVCAIILTFLVYTFVLGSLEPGGIMAGYMQDHGASLCMHLIVPLLVAADFFINDTFRPYGKSCILYSLLPPLAYLAFIFILSASGVRWADGTMSAPYPFLNTDAPAGWFGFVPESAGYTTLGIGVGYMITLIVALVMAIAAILRFFANIMYSRKSP